MDAPPEEAVDSLPADARQAYTDARLQGLCHEGAWEVAVSRLAKATPSAPPPPDSDR